MIRATDTAVTGLPQDDDLSAGTPKAPELPGILFDQFSRYASCAETVRALLPNGGTILDVGSGRPRLLGRILGESLAADGRGAELSGYDIRYLDPGLEADADDAIASDVFTSQLDGQTFDVVASIDTLEHVPVAQRDAFLARLRELATRGVVLAAPFADDTTAAEIDRHVNQVYEARTGNEYSWLKEHEEFGLPLFAPTADVLGGSGWTVSAFGNGHAPWLRSLLVPHVLLLDQGGEHREFLERVGQRFREDLYAFDHLVPVYRQVLVAWTGSTPKLREYADDEAARAAADAAWAQFEAWYQVELAGHIDSLTGGVSELRDRLMEMQSVSRARITFLESELERVQDEASEVQQQREADWELERRTLQSRLQQSREEMAKRGLSGKVVDRMLGGVQSVARRVGLRGEFKWKVKSGFFAALYPVVKNTKEYREFCEVREWRRRASEVVPVSALSDIPEAHPDRDDVIVFGIIDWSFRIQRPQHLAREFARLGHRVFYISPRFVDKVEPGFHVEPIRGVDGVFEVRLHATGAPVIYRGQPVGEARDVLFQSLRLWMSHVRLASAQVIVEHPAWVGAARTVPRSVCIYDCMDNHHGFEGTAVELARVEESLVRQADGLVVTSDWLADEVRPRRGDGPMALVRNGCEPEHFLPLTMPVDPQRCIGYFGAIAEWFDAELVADVARMFPECRVLLVGADTAKAGDVLTKFSNVEMTGEMPYARLPEYLEQMDVCLIPFVINDLTRATNPVKAYEALAAGRPVVATPMPELMADEFVGLVRVAERGPDFIRAVREALVDAREPERVAERRSYARTQSWAERARAFDKFVARIPGPLVSVVVVTWNNVDLSRRCVRSVLDDAAAPNLEVIVVDNASTDETSAWLEELEENEARVRVIRNVDNRGFAPACNQGLEAARGQWMVILNNDLVVTRGWLRTMVGHFRRDASIGLLGPLTNNIGNEARVPTKYESMEEMELEQARLTAANAGQSFDIAVLAFFCVMIPRTTYEKVGGLDEGFEVGFFEDDDYCRRVRDEELRVVCAEDVFIHHELSASFQKLDRAKRDAIFAANKAYFESKWGEWTPHRYRQPARATTGG